MNPSTAEGANRKLVLRESLRRLCATAQEERARRPADSRGHEFYLGVEAAAQDALHPERAGAKADDWLARESPAFRDGYARARTLVAAAASSEPPPAVITLPAFDAAG